MAVKPTREGKQHTPRLSADDYAWGSRHSGIDRHAAQCGQERGEAHVMAANAHVRQAEASADEWTDDGPVWLGWALHRAFLAGAAWERVRQWGKERNGHG